jgi:hypothetical protein
MVLHASHLHVVLLWLGLAGSASTAWSRREGSDNFHLFCETEHVVEQDATHPVHVRLRGELAPAVAVGPLLSLSLDHHDNLLAAPALATGECVRGRQRPHHDFFFVPTHRSFAS